MGLFLAAACWIVVVFADGGVIMGSIVIILGVDIGIARLLALNMYRRAMLNAAATRAARIA